MSRSTLPLQEVAGSHRRRAAQLDLCVRVCYEGAGTVGAFLTTPLIAVFGEAYGLAPVPILLSLAGIGYRLLRRGSIAVKGDTSLDDSRHSNASCDGASAPRAPQYSSPRRLSYRRRL